MSDAESRAELAGNDMLSESELKSTSNAPLDPADTEQMDAMKYLTLFALSACFTGSQISTYFGGAPLLAVAEDLGVNTYQRSWIQNSGSLSSACIVLSIGYLQDIIGRRTLLASGLFLTLLGTLLYAVSRSFPLALVGNIFVGAGSIIQELSAVSAIAELVPSRKRGLFLGLATAMSTIFTPAVLYSNLLTDKARSNWRWLQWISFIWNGVTVILLALSYFRLKLQTPPRISVKKLVKEVDYVGIVLFITSVALIIVALSDGGSQDHPWNSAAIIIEFVVGFVGLVSFATWEYCFPKRPLVPRRLFQGQRVVGLSLIACLASGINFSTGLSLTPTVITEVFRYSGVKDGLLGLPPAIGLAVGAASGNILLSMFRSHCREILVGATIIMTAFTAAQAAIEPNDAVTWDVLAFFSSVGIGASLLPISTIVTLACPKDLIGTAVAIVISLRTLAGTAGFAIFNNIYSTGRIKRAPSEGEQQASADSIKTVYLATLAFGIIATITLACLPNMKRYMTDVVLTRSMSQKV